MDEARALADRLLQGAPLAQRATKEVAVRAQHLPIARGDPVRRDDAQGRGARPRTRPKAGGPRPSAGRRSGAAADRRRPGSLRFTGHREGNSQGMANQQQPGPDAERGVRGGSAPFDVFAGWSSRIASRAAFFTFCVLLVVVWVPTFFVLRDVDTWQLIINTVTTIITFLMVALLQNSSDAQRSGGPAQAQRDRRRPRRPHGAHRQPAARNTDLRQDLVELRAAVGLEAHESSSEQQAPAAASC